MIMTHEDDTLIREWVKENVLAKASDIKFTEDRFEHYDVEYTLNGKIRKLEIKNRHFNHNKYLTTDIELDKWDYMTGNSVQLCVVFDDGVLFYTSKDVAKNYYIGITRHTAPDQYNPSKNNDMKMVSKIFCALEIDESKFYPYDEYFTSKPSREIIPSIYND